jgi:hypothetical protein
MEFGIEAWSAYAPGIEAPGEWQAWARAPWRPFGDDVPALAEMPAMQRRRVERLGRMALQVAWRCQPDADQEIPLVFASRHGDLARTYGMLGALARDEGLSPTHFGLSTHNAIAAQYSIARALTGNYLVVSAGAGSAGAAVVEAQALLADGAAAVLVVVYDGRMPDDYAAFRDEPDADYAWAWRIVRARPGIPVLSFAAATDGPAGGSDHRPPRAGDADTAEGAARRLPHGLEVLRFFLAGEAMLDEPDGAHRWRRHA